LGSIGPYLLRLKGTVLDLSARTHVMGILNLTPDSFSDGGAHFGRAGGSSLDVAGAVEAALKMADEGADIIDVGGESTRPGAQAVPSDVEIARVVPVIEGIRRHSQVPISVDTTKTKTAGSALSAGASIINDISGGTFDSGMYALAAASGAAMVLMHIKGTPADMQKDPSYGDVVGEVCARLGKLAEDARAAGVPGDMILVDPGIGFGKTVSHNLRLIVGMDAVADLGYPVVLGVSRKAFIGALTGGAPASDRLEGSLAASVLGVARGAHIIRAHDVKATKRAALVADAILRA
jgi:dihydropteroate synthase